MELKKIKVYKRPLEDSQSFFDSEGLPKTRLWTVGPVPEDARKTCYLTWEKAMEWATMSHDGRVAIIIDAAKWEMGQ